MARKFQDGESVTVTDKFPKHLLRSWGLDVGSTHIIDSLSYDGHYHVKKSVDSKLTHRVPTVAIAKITGGKRMQLQEQIEKAEGQIERTKAFIRVDNIQITGVAEKDGISIEEIIKSIKELLLLGLSKEQIKKDILPNLGLKDNLTEEISNLLN